MPEPLKHSLVGRHAAPIWRTHGGSGLSGVVLSGAGHAAIVIAVLASLGYPFAGSHQASPLSMEVVIEPRLLEDERLRPPDPQDRPTPRESRIEQAAERLTNDSAEPGSPTVPSDLAGLARQLSAAADLSDDRGPERNGTQGSDRGAAATDAAATIVRERTEDQPPAPPERTPAAEVDDQAIGKEIHQPDPTAPDAPLLAVPGEPETSAERLQANLLPVPTTDMQPDTGDSETELARVAAQIDAIEWLGARLQRLIERLPADQAMLARPETRVALRALEARSRNLQGAAARASEVIADTHAKVQGTLPGQVRDRAQLDAIARQVEDSRAEVAANARAVLEALPPVLARLPQEETRWAAYMGSTLEQLIAAQERALSDLPAPPPPVPDPDQQAILELTRPQEREAALAEPSAPIAPPASPTEADYRSALMAARLVQAAGRGIPAALYNLANALLAADGMARDPEHAVAILRELAQQGYRPAQIRYAEVAMLGDGMPASEAEAKAWFDIAAANGSPAAQRASAMLSPRLSPAVRAEAERIVALWQAQARPQAAPSQDDLDRQLAQAIEQQSFAEVERLLQDGADPQTLVDGGRTALVGAAWRGRRQIVKILVEGGVLMDARDEDQRNALLWAAINGYGDIADDLLDLGADVDVRDSDGSTPLIRAAWNGRYDIVARLLGAGANPSLRDTAGKNAADRAEVQGDARILTLLGQAGGAR